MAVFENFISYRRSESAPAVKIIYDTLRAKGVSVFCDVYSIGSGDFTQVIDNSIKSCTNFILVLGRNSMQRCMEPNDWLHHEISLALTEKKNIICLFTDHDFVFPNCLPIDIQQISNYNGLFVDVIHIENYIDNLINQFIVYEEHNTVSDEQNDFVVIDSKLIKYVGSAPVVKIPLNVTTICREAFKDQTKVVKVVFHDEITVIEDSAFERCIALQYISLPARCKKLGEQAFCRCYNLVHIDFNAELTEIGKNCFSYCEKLKNAQIGPHVCAIHSSAFNYCSHLIAIDVNNYNKDYVSDDGILYNIDKSCLIRCPENHAQDILDLPKTLIEIGPWAFFRCAKILDLKLPNSIVRIGENAFKDCCNITSLALGDSIKEFPLSAIEGWKPSQKIVMGNKFSPILKYTIENKLSELSKLEEVQFDCKYCLIKTAFESEEEAIGIAKMLLDNNLISSGQIKKMRSLYLWEDEVSNELEYELTCFTESILYKEVEKYIEEHHSYEQCELICIPVIGISDGFSDWISKYTTNIKYLKK